MKLVAVTLLGLLTAAAGGAQELPVGSGVIAFEEKLEIGPRTACWPSVVWPALVVGPCFKMSKPPAWGGTTHGCRPRYADVPTDTEVVPSAQSRE